MAAGEKSTAVNFQPRQASQITRRPSPQPLSSTRGRSAACSGLLLRVTAPRHRPPSHRATRPSWRRPTGATRSLVGLQQRLEVRQDRRPAVLDAHEHLAVRLEDVMGHGQLDRRPCRLDLEGHLQHGQVLGHGLACRVQDSAQLPQRLTVARSPLPYEAGSLGLGSVGLESLNQLAGT